MPELASSLFGNADKMPCAQAQARAPPVQHQRQTLPNLPFCLPKIGSALLVYIGLYRKVRNKSRGFYFFFAIFSAAFIRGRLLLGGGYY